MADNGAAMSTTQSLDRANDLLRFFEQLLRFAFVSKQHQQIAGSRELIEVVAGAVERHQPAQQRRLVYRHMAEAIHARAARCFIVEPAAGKISGGAHACRVGFSLHALIIGRRQFHQYISCAAASRCRVGISLLLRAAAQDE